VPAVPATPALTARTADEEELIVVDHGHAETLVVVEPTS